MRPAWKGVLHQNALKREKTKTFNMSPLHKLHRMQDSETEEGCLQAFVRPPSSKIQILWSLIGSLLIVWDLITIPLELFDVQSLINFLVQVGRFSFAFWVVDVLLGFPGEVLDWTGDGGNDVGMSDDDETVVSWKMILLLLLLLLLLGVVVLVVVILSCPCDRSTTNEVRTCQTPTAGCSL